MGSGITTKARDQKMSAGIFSKGKSDSKFEEKQYSFQNEDHYTGSWVNNKRSGDGVYHYNNGDKYIGAWLNDKKHGFGKYMFQSGNWYEGDWLYGKKNGTGKFSFQNGDFYNGAFRNDKLNGRGTYHYYENGEKYVGFWKNNVIFGKGVRYPSGGLTRIIEEWEDGVSVSSREITSKKAHDDEEENILSGRVYKGKEKYKLDPILKDTGGSNKASMQQNIGVK